ncbi:hypothetical protein GCM10022215_16450 [Nocardioides fonticola]|uniref:Uncharacterized protein n=1 Tax=Nocardioides fonticola TaxID=450363 RepID=A0ABP7XJR1_9ACTN
MLPTLGWGLALAVVASGCSAGAPIETAAPPPAVGGAEAPGAPVDVWRTGTLSVLGSPGAASCLVLTTPHGRFQLISGDGRWVPHTAFRNGRVDTAASGFQRGTGQAVLPGVVYPAGSRVRVYGHTGIEPGVVVRQHCPTDVVPDFLTDYRVTAAR